MLSDRLKNRSRTLFSAIPPHGIFVAALWAVSFLVYWNSFDVPFQFDDFDFVRNNESIRNLDPATIWSFHSTRFLTFVSFALNYRVHGISVFGFHVVNFFIHLVAVATVYFFALLFFRLDVDLKKDSVADYGAAFVVALLFASHPLQTEAVTYISQRPASLMACFYILALTFYLASSIWRERGDTFRSRLFLACAFVFAVMAMFSKQSAITLPGAIVLLEACRFGVNKTNWKQKLLRSLPFFLAASLVPLTALLFADVERADNLLQSALLPSYWEHAWTEIGVLKNYLALLVWPVGQNIDHDILLHKSFWDPEILFSLGLHVVFLISAVRCRKKNPAICFGIIFYYLALSVESFLVRLPDRMVEHRLYLPSLGIFLAFAGWARDTAREWEPALRTQPRAKRAAWLGLALLALPLGILTHERNEIWRNDESLWWDSVSKAPGKPRPLVNLSRIFYRHGQCEKAIEPLHVAAVNAPSYYTAHRLLGLCLVRLGHFDAAITELNTALSLSAELGTAFNSVREEAYFGLAEAHAGKGDAKAALKYYRECVEAGPAYYVPSFEGMGRILAKSHERDAAIDAFHQALNRALAEGTIITPMASRITSRCFWSAVASRTFELRRILPSLPSTMAFPFLKIFSIRSIVRRRLGSDQTILNGCGRCENPARSGPLIDGIDKWRAMPLKTLIGKRRGFSYWKEGVEYLY